MFAAMAISHSGCRIRSSRIAGDSARRGVVVHPRGLPAAVVEQLQLAGQDLGLGHAGAVGQLGQ